MRFLRSGAKGMKVKKFLMDPLSLILSYIVTLFIWARFTSWKSFRKEIHSMEYVVIWTFIRKQFVFTVYLFTITETEVCF